MTNKFLMNIVFTGLIITLVSCNKLEETLPPTNLGKQYTWEEINEIANNHPENIFKVGDYLNIQFPYQDISDGVGGIIVDEDNHEDGILENDGNEVYQTARIIGFNYDDISESKKAGITFQFTNLISDEEGYSIATLYNDISDANSSNHNFTTSSLRKALTGEGGFINDVGWYQKNNTTRTSSSFANNVPILNLLPNDLKAVIKPVIKNVSKYDLDSNSWVNTNFTDKLFLLSKDEMIGNESYQYYKEHNNPKDRILTQIKKNDDAIQTPTRVDDNHYYTDNTYTDKSGTHHYEENKGYNFAGYNYDEDYGGLGWLRSPHIDAIIPGADIVHNDGSINSYDAYTTILAIAPAFCI